MDHVSELLARAQKEIAKTVSDSMTELAQEVEKAVSALDYGESS